MGLDITAYERVTFKRARPDDGDYDYEGGEDCLVSVYAPRGQDDGMPDGIYQTEGERIAFRAGSYSGYNLWRSYLAKLVGTTDAAVFKGGDAPAFVELINFSDCEGFIGPKTSAKLAADFAAWRERAQAFANTIGGEERDWWLEKYEKWASAFALAAKGGAVDFH